MSDNLWEPNRDVGFDIQMLTNVVRLRSPNISIEKIFWLSFLSAVFQCPALFLCLPGYNFIKRDNFVADCAQVVEF